MYGFLFDRVPSQVGQIREPLRLLAPLLPLQRVVAPTVTLSPCNKPSSYATWEQWLDVAAPGWSSYDYSDPSTIFGRARCPGSSPGSEPFTQRFPRDPTNRYFVAFRKWAAQQIACVCCKKCPPALRTAPGFCPSGYTRVDFILQAFGTTPQRACSICLPGADLTMTGRIISSLCINLTDLGGMYHAPTDGHCTSGYTRLDVHVRTSFGEVQHACSYCVEDGDLAATGSKIQRLCDRIPSLVPGAYRAPE